MQEFLPPKDKMCHMTQFEKSCFDCVVTKGCQKWVGIEGKDPQTGRDVKFWSCADGIIHLGLLEIAQKVNQLGAAVESFRNDTMRVNAANVIRETDIAIQQAMQQGALPAPQLKAIEDHGEGSDL